MKTESESIEAVMRRGRVLFAGFGARMENTRLPECVIFVELVGGAGCVGGQKEEWMGCLLADLRAFGISADQWTIEAQDEREWRKTEEEEAERAHGEMDHCGESQGWTTACSSMPYITRRIKEKIAQSKRVRTGLIAMVD